MASNEVPEIELIEIGLDGRPARQILLSEIAQSVCDANMALYQKSGYQRPWIGYLALIDDQTVGTCAFKSPPSDGTVEIAYFTFPEHEGRGIATAMAVKMLTIASKTDQSVRVTAQTLPEVNASTTILRKLNFQRAGLAIDDDVGEVWVWELPHSRRTDA